MKQKNETIEKEITNQFFVDKCLDLDREFAEKEARKQNTWILKEIPAPFSKGLFHFHCSRFNLADGKTVDVFHAKPIYYHTKVGYTKPLSEICSYHGNKTIVLKDHPFLLDIKFDYLMGLMKRQKMMGSELRFKGVGHLAFAVSPETYLAGAGDGFVRRASADTVWDNAHDTAAGTNAFPTIDEWYVGYIAQNEGSYYNIGRSFFPFDTSALPDTAIITASVFSLYAMSVYDQDNDGDDFLGIVQTSQASNITLAVGDYDACGDVHSPAEGANRIDLGDIVTSDYNAFTLDAIGRGWVSKNGYTLLGVREGHDILDHAIAAGTWNAVGACFSEYTGTDKDPKLVVTYEVSEAVLPSRLASMQVG